MKHFPLRRLTCNVAVVMLCAFDAVSLAASAPRTAIQSEYRNPTYRSELISLFEKDQALYNPANGLSTTAIRKENLEIQKRLKELVKQHGWPTNATVGADAASDAVSIAAHADNDPAFQRQVLGILKKLVSQQQASPADYAVLYDRLKINAGGKQLYGTQGWCFHGRWLPYPIEDADQVDQRRRAMKIFPASERDWAVVAAQHMCVLYVGQPKNPAYRAALLVLRHRDQATRQPANGKIDWASVRKGDLKNRQALKALIKQYGWPTYAAVGKDAADAAALIAIHADNDPAFQDYALNALKKLIPEKQGSLTQYAYLYDRIQVNAKKKQLYGTQGVCTKEGVWRPDPIEDSINVNDRREAAGIYPVSEEEYAALAASLSCRKVKNLDIHAK